MRANGVDVRLKALDRLEKDGRPRSALEASCIERQRADLLKGNERGLVWREDAAANAVRFFGLLRHWKGKFAGRPLNLEPWQEELCIAPLFGWYREDGRRRFTIGYDEEPRKNGKTTKAAGIALQGTVADGEQGAETYAAATKRDQACILFDDAKNMVRQSPALLKRLKLWQFSITCPGLNGSFKPLSADHNSLHGLNVHRAVVDEVHSHKTRDLWDVIRTATAARRNPLVFGITTAGYDRSSICWELHERSRAILEGHTHDDGFFAFIACADPEDDPFDPATWRKANPNFGISIEPEYLADEAARAKDSASYENTFRRLHLNQWTEQAVRWLPMHLWDANKDEFTEDDLEGQECWGGLDLASTRDVTALVLVFRHEGGYRLLPYFWVPEDVDDQRSDRDRRQVMNWSSKGLVRKTPGNVTDYAFVRADIERLAKKFHIMEIAFDPWQAMETALELGREGIEMTEFRQGFANFAEPTKEFERLCVSRKLRHNANPVLRWMAGNVSVRTDPSGNIRPDKGNSSDKIDGIVAAIMAIGRAIQSEGSSVYEREGRGFVAL